MRFECVSCNYQTDHKVTFDRHLNSKKHLRGGSQKEYSCEKCGYITNFSTSFKKHMKIHDCNFHCTLCNFDIQDEELILRHLKSQSHQKKVKANPEFMKKKSRIDSSKIHLYITSLKDQRVPTFDQLFNQLMMKTLGNKTKSPCVRVVQPPKAGVIQPAMQVLSEGAVHPGVTIREVQLNDDDYCEEIKRAKKHIKQMLEKLDDDDERLHAENVMSEIKGEDEDAYFEYNNLEAELEDIMHERRLHLN